MNMHNILLPLTVFSQLSLAFTVVPDDYLISDDEKVTYLYTDEHASQISEVKRYQGSVMDLYEDEFGYKLDDKLFVGIASSKNQIANAFSMQIPLNGQILYGAGAAYIDYFSSTSWLKTLLIHETAHNFQLNPKENALSRHSHRVLGNSPLSFVGFFPLFPIPNILESSFLLEGNAVMNESRFGNGGRLFSGYALAEVVTLAKAGKITPELMYNQTLDFPYGEKFYLVGGFFEQFLVERYGVERVNAYFKTFASQAFPFFTNKMFKKQYGESFEALLAAFAKEVQVKHNDFQATQGEPLLRSQIFVPLNKAKHELYTLIEDNQSAPKVFKFDTQTMKQSLEEGSWRVGEVFKHHGQYYTQSSAKTSPVKIEMGLFDKNGFMQKGFEGKALQGFTNSGKEVYFDIENSLDVPQVYVDGVFYTLANSSVYVDGEDLYYFKQEGLKRTLYKNRTALVSFEGHYGFVSDVDAEGKIYFIASSQHGSSVYRANNGKIERVCLADDVIDFKLLDSREALVATIDANGYAYTKIALESRRIGFNRPHQINIVQDGRLKPTLRDADFLSNSEHLKSEDYNAFKALKYSSLNQALSYGSYEGAGIDLQANFVDPLLQNSLALVLSHNNKRSIVGTRYDNQANQLLYGGALYGVHKNNEVINNENRALGYDAYLALPWLASGYWRADTMVSYTKDYANIYREPLTLSLNLSNIKQFGVSKYANSLNALSLFGSVDRETSIWGASYTFKQELGWSSYLGLEATYMKSDRVNFFEEKGIELREGFSSLQFDKATLSVPSFSSKTYAQEVKMAEVSLAKVFDGSCYFFSLPLSLQRESLYAKQRLYDIDFSNTVQRSYYESVLGMELDLLLFHKLEIPLSLEWIHNKDVVDQNKFNVLLGTSF